MSLIVRLAVLAALVLGLYSIYQSPAYHSDLDRVGQELLSRINSLQSEVSQPVGDLVSRTTEVRVPRAQLFDWQKVGSAGSTILGGSTRLMVEIDYAKPTAPRPDDTATIASILQKYSGKQVEMAAGNEIAIVKDSYTLTDLVEVTKSNRSCFSDINRTCLYVLFLPGKFEGSTTLGVSFTATATAFFAEQAENSANPIAPRNRLAKATLTHELGHFFGLVNLSYQSDTPHEDPTHPGHSKNPSSVMDWAVEDFSLRAILSGGPPTGFDADDEADMAKIKASK